MSWVSLTTRREVFTSVKGETRVGIDVSLLGIAETHWTFKWENLNIRIALG